MLFKWINIDNIIVIISAVIVVRRSGIVISSKDINLMFGYTLKNILRSWRVDTQTSCRWKASLLINVGRINLLQNYYSTEIKTSCNLSAWFERFEEQLCCNEAVPHSSPPTPPSSALTLHSTFLSHLKGFLSLGQNMNLFENLLGKWFFISLTKVLNNKTFINK